ncbi:hypothetical protein FGO68_gene9556 [Halteria grandinella]|uniref:Uncharacterized protein n=1 Tax=Halteria grandinella TaxID=5974 RepID=A0A8J8P0N5_HALGN|nr:hypothetical protein FGO68_gene9556 [Halteria grandinella]
MGKKDKKDKKEKKEKKEKKDKKHKKDKKGSSDSSDNDYDYSADNVYVTTTTYPASAGPQNFFQFTPYDDPYSQMFHQQRQQYEQEMKMEAERQMQEMRDRARHMEREYQMLKSQWQQEEREMMESSEDEHKKKKKKDKKEKKYKKDKKSKLEALLLSKSTPIHYKLEAIIFSDEHHLSEKAKKKLIKRDFLHEGKYAFTRVHEKYNCNDLIEKKWNAFEDILYEKTREIEEQKRQEETERDDDSGIIKALNVVGTAIVSGAAIVGGALIASTGVGAVAGAALIGAGVSGVTNSIQQAASDEKDFDHGSFFTNALIGSATGVVTGGIGAAGGAITSKIAADGAKIAVQVGTGITGGTVGSATSQALSNVAAGKDFDEGLGTAMLTGALSGGVGAGLGQASRGVSNALTKGNLATVGEEVGKNAFIRGGLQVATSTLSGALTGSLSQLVKNAINSGEINRYDLIDYLQSQVEGEWDGYKFEKLWQKFVKLKRVEGDKLYLDKKGLKKVLKKDKFSSFHRPLKYLYEELSDLGKGVLEAGLLSGTMGGGMGIISAAAQEHQHKQDLKHQIREYAEKNTGKDGKLSSTIEVKELAQATKKGQVIHHEDGKKTLIPADDSHGKGQDHYKFLKQDGKVGHYRAADAQGKDIIKAHDQNRDGNCFMEEAKTKLGVGTAQDARNALKEYVMKDPLKAAKYVTMDELQRGGDLKGGCSACIKQFDDGDRDPANYDKDHMSDSLHPERKVQKSTKDRGKSLSKLENARLREIRGELFPEADAPAGMRESHGHVRATESFYKAHENELHKNARSAASDKLMPFTKHVRDGNIGEANKILEEYRSDPDKNLDYKGTRASFIKKMETIRDAKLSKK